MASGGTLLNTHADSGPLAIGTATLAPGAPGPALTVAGQVATLAGGRIGAGLDLRDRVLPGLQADLDGFAQVLASGFDGQGLTLFTDGGNAVPASATPGLAQTLQVSALVTATPSAVRDGSAAAGAAGDTTLIDALLAGVLATGPGSLASQASGIVANHAALAGAAQDQVSTAQGVLSSLQSKLAMQTGVSIDSELTQMVQLQNSYGANAKVLTALQAMWTQFLDSVK